MDGVVRTEETKESVHAGRTVLLLGATGRTGGRVLRRLLERGVRVRAVVRSVERLPADAGEHVGLSVTVADLPSLSAGDLAELVLGCDAVVSCLGHTPDLQGIYGRPRDLVTQVTQRVCGTIEAARPERPVRLVLMSSVSVNDPAGQRTRRRAFEKLTVWMLRGLLPPARDNQHAADFLLRDIGDSDPYVQWTAVRPDTLRDGDACDYALHDGLVDSVFRPGATSMANVADFMCELVTDDQTWAAWRGRLPVIVNDGAG